MPRYTEPFLLSDRGSDRATAYASSNKSVTLDGKTLVVWTDAVSITSGRTFDHASDTWSDTVRLGEGTDNHNSPSLTADERGHLRIAFGPHGTWQRYEDGYPRGCFKSAISAQPNTLEGMDRNDSTFGYHATYPSLMALPGGVCIVYRGGEVPYGTQFQRLLPQGAWSAAKELMRMDIPPQYTHWGSIITGDDQGTIYVAGHFYEITHKRSAGVCVLKSTDQGDTWTDLREQTTSVPIRYHERFAAPHRPAEFDPRVEGLCVDDRRRLWILCSSMSAKDRSMLLSCWDGGWRTTELSAFVPSDRAITAGGLCITRDGVIHVVASVGDDAAINDADRENNKWWSHPTLEVAHLMSTDGGQSFSFDIISDGDPTTPNWLPTISRPGPFHPVDRPVILWTQGFTGDQSARCRPDTNTNVWCRFVEAV